MPSQESDIATSSRILELLSDAPQGASIGEISSALHLNRNLVAKYLSILHMQGRVELRSYGKVKLYKITTRIPFHALSLVTRGCVIGLDQLFYVKEVLGYCREMTGSDTKELLSKPFSEIFHPAFTDPVVKKYIQEYRNGAVAPPLYKEISWRKRGFDLTVVPCIFDDGTQGLALILAEQAHNAPSHKKEKNQIRTYQYLTHETPNFILHLSAEGDVLYLNESYATYCNARVSDLLHTNGIPLATHDDFIRIKEGVLKNWSLNEPTISDIQVVMDDGSVRWQTWVFHPLREQGILTELHGYGRDITDERERENLYLRLQKEFNQDVQEKTSELREITAQLRKEIDERKSLELALKRSEEKYRKLTEITTDIIWETDLFGTIVYINPKATSILGYSPEELVGKKIWNKINSDYRSHIEHYFSGATCSSFEQIAFPMTRSDGSEVWIEFSGIPLFNDDHQFSGYRGIGRDIIKSKLIEEHNQRLRAIIENTPDIVRISDIHGDLLYMNKAGRKILKIPETEDITRYNNASFMTSDDWTKILEGRSIAIKDGIWQGLTRLIATDGTIIPVSQVIIAHKKGNGEEMLFSTVARDISEITRFRQELEDASIYSRNLIEVNLDPLVTIGPDGKIQDVNHATEMVTGYARDKLIGTDFCAYFKDPKKAREGYERVFSQGYVRDYPLEIIHKDGHSTPVLYNASVYQDKNGNVQGVFAAARDITEIVKFQKKLEESNNYTRNLIEASLDPLVTIGKDGKIQDVNHATEMVTGYARENLIGTDFCAYFKDPKKAREGYERVFSQGYVRDYPLEIIHKDGHSTPVLYNASVYMDKNGNIQGVFAAARDITALLESEFTLAESQDYYLKILDEFPNPIWRSGPDAKCNYFNKAWLKFTGRTREEEDGDGWATGVHPDDLERCISIYLSSFDKKIPFYIQYRLRHHDGTYHRIADYGAPLYDLKGVFTGYIGSCYDLDGKEIL
ncbi:PAS domain S-box protein [Methanospirillum hungatei]|uniref:PAS domain S-box protein n=1 Tax=Methanospirillum hungatei TaxID=2203 RepID=UPI0026F20F28|nr:PAS domain S-box protein [Methanospirillum hungatei]MCA1916530.1 PAS domain S-box protein [Methanospirillum hungatei]